MRKHISVFVLFALVLGMLLSACGPTPTEAPTEEPEPQTTAVSTPEETADEPEEPMTDFSVGMVTDMGGIDDKSFNATSWKGVEMAIEELGVEGSYLESQQQTDYATNITQYINQETDLIITVGFLLADDTAVFAEENPDMNFAIVDVDWLGLDNVRQLSFSTDQAGFLAGYIAAGATKTGKVATFGGINIPSVAIFMIGYEAGVEYYNEMNGTDVEVLGWSTADNNGVFAGNFESTDDGRRIAEEFLAEGADVIMPVAGPVGLGSAEAVKAAGDAWIIGVDTDWTVSAPEYAEVVLTSVLKNMDVAIYDTIELAAGPDFGGFGGETYVGTLENNGVGVAGVAEGAVDEAVVADLDAVKAGIIDGSLDTGWAAYINAPAEPVEETLDATGFTVGMVTDMGGIDDKSFNATSWKGVEMAVEDFNVTGSYLESQQQTDYATNITQYLNQETDLIITVGFLLADDTAVFAEENPDVNFAIVDVDWLGLDNVRQLSFSTDQAGFLAGYIAAGATKTGKVATFGGINIPSVAIFMIGYEAGVEYYNEMNGTDVEVLGWNTAENTGVFAGNFESTDDGRRIAEEFLAEGADVIMPVAGPVGLGSAEAVKAAGDAWIIGVDTDWTVSAPEYAEVVLTSVLKNMDVAIYDTIELAAGPDFGGFGGETYVGTLENNGVGVAGVAEGAVSDDVTAELDAIIDGIISGDIDTGWAAYISSL